MSEQSDQPDSDEARQVTEESSVYARGQTVIPKMIRDALAIEYGTKLHWEVREGVIHVMPIPKNPVRALRGILKGKGPSVAELLEIRRQERELEAAREKRLLQ